MKLKSKKPVIGVTLGYAQEDLIIQGIRHNFIRREYGEQLRKAGASPLFLDASIDPNVAATLCDGILISGGEDIEPSFYGTELQPGHKIEPSARTIWERELIRACDARGKHILGICYGAQLLNVHYGGTLHQDITVEVENIISHGATDKIAMHRVQFSQDFLGYQNHDDVMTGCRHHQAVKDLAPGFSVAASAPDGIIEAITGHGHFGVQWHAEADGTAETIYASFVSLVARRRPTVRGSLSRWFQPDADLA